MGSSTPPRARPSTRTCSGFPRQSRSSSTSSTSTVSADIRQDRAARAAFNSSGISRNNRLIERHESTNGAYWRSDDFAGNSDRKNIFAHPLGPGAGDDEFDHDGRETIFALPNGLSGYMLMDARGTRIDKGPMEIVRDNKQADGAVVNGISCMSCHNRGLIEKADQLREVVEQTKAFDKHAGPDRGLSRSTPVGDV
jgi:hypothetical protein